MDSPLNLSQSAPDLTNTKSFQLGQDFQKWEKIATTKSDHALASEQNQEPAGFAVNSWQWKLLLSLKKFPAKKFETLMQELLQEMAIKLNPEMINQRSREGSLDGFGYLREATTFQTKRVAVRAEQLLEPIQPNQIERFWENALKNQADYGIFITTSSFTPAARRAAWNITPTLTLIDGEDLVELLARYQLHLKKVTTYELGDFYKE